jgi:hypothetical protein
MHKRTLFLIVTGIIALCIVLLGLLAFFFNPTDIVGRPTGCPDATTVSKLPPANITLKRAQAYTTVSARKGDIIEIDMPFGLEWQLSTVNPQDLLIMQKPAGFVSSAAQACVWRFIATKTGTVRFTFSGRNICARDQPCPQDILAIWFIIQIK